MFAVEYRGRIKEMIIYFLCLLMPSLFIVYPLSNIEFSSITNYVVPST